MNRPTTSRRSSLPFAFTVALVMAAASFHFGDRSGVIAQGPGPCAPPNGNPIVCENALAGNPSGEWDVSGAGDPTIQGYATDISVNRGQTVSFKILTDATNYRLDIYRMGFYGGMGARKVATVNPSVTLPQTQPSCLNDAATGLIDCGNWAVSATWAVPADAVSGIYFAKATRTDSGGASHIVFVIRDDSGQSDLLFQTSDTTWQAYNSYGGNSLYQGSPAGRAYKVSYNRPFNTRAGTTAEDWVFNAEYPMVRWLESNGYNVSYFTGVDSDRFGAEILEHKAFLSVGHDEYWSGAQRTNVEAARTAGVHLAFFSGNEVFWKTRWENSISSPSTPNRTLVSYKETHANAKIDPTAVWTGTWRDPSFSPPADGGRPENNLTGTIFAVNSGTASIKVPSAEGRMRFWRNTSVANLAPGGLATLPTGTLGYEWDEDQDNGFRPAGLIRMSDTTVSGVSYLQDLGSTYAPGTANHALTLYRNSNGALVFGAGTVQWSWGLDSNHDRGAAAPSVDMQQATLNLLADMGSQPLTLQAGLVPATASTDTTAPSSVITFPAHGSIVPANTTVTVAGTATDSGGGIVGGVEVSVDGGATWRRASGRESWTYTWQTGAARTVSLFVRAADDSGNLQQPLTGNSVTVAGGSVNCPCSLWTPSQVPTGPAESDTGQVELGTRFRADFSGYVTGIRFYKPLQNSGTHVGHLWTAGGTLLSSVAFTNESPSGWQEATLPSAVQVTAGTIYVVSYNTSSGFYSASGNYFAAAGVNNGPLHAPQTGTEGGGNGVYQYGANLFPDQTYIGSNYWVDVVFVTSVGADTTAPLVSSTTPAPGSSGVLPTATITATFNENVINVSSATFELTSGGVIPATVTYSAGARTATLTPNAPLAPATTYLARLKSGVGGIADNSGNLLAGDFVWSFTTSSASSLGCPCTIWPSSQVPAVITAQDASGVELGVKFRTSVDGSISGIRFYKGPQNTGGHVGTLWTNLGTSLATVAFSNETATGWQTAFFNQPVPVTANTVYVVSYQAPNGFYSLDGGYFGTSAHINGPLEALADGAAGGNGVFRYGPTAFPTSTFNGGNYWVDVVFNPSGPPDTTAPTVSVTQPTANATNVAVTSSARVVFSEAMNPASVNGGSFELRDAGNNVVAATVSYDQLTREATLQPTLPMAYTTTYAATVKGGPGGVKDLADNPLAPAGYTWTFSTADAPPPPPDEGPGGPIMVVSSTTKPFSKYYAEVLRAEGLNGFVVSDITAVTASKLAAHDVVILGEMALTPAQVSLFTNWVAAGGKLIAMRPDKQLAGLLGLTDAAATLSDGYMQVDTSAAPGTGIVGETMQFHGTADLYAVNGATPVATLYATATAATTSPAVTLRGVGAAGGQAAAFTYDLARSIVLTRQGNPAWAGQETDGIFPIRSDELFFRAGSPDYVDRTKIAIPQADEQQRLLANLIGLLSRDRTPIPRFWYFPRGLKAVVVMTGDDHASANGTAGQFDWFNSRSVPGCNVANWECLRSTSYIFMGTPLSAQQVANYTAQGFEIAAHVSMSGTVDGSPGSLNTCNNFTPTSLNGDLQMQLAAFGAAFGAAGPPRTNRTHCIVWSDYTTEPETELTYGIRLDTNYYYWPNTWVNNVPGLFTGSAMPMRFAKADGSMIDVYQAATQMTDESGQAYPFTAEALLDRALGPLGYYGAYVTNMHTDDPNHAGAQAITVAAQVRGVPVISALQLLDWLDARNGATYAGLAWVGNSLSFSLSAGPKANGLQMLVPAAAGNRSVTSVTRDGQAIPFTLQLTKGVIYAVFDSAPGVYSVQYSIDNTIPSITALTVTPDAFDARVTWTTNEVADSRVAYGTSPNALSSTVATVDISTTHSMQLKGLTPDTTYYFRATSADLAGNAATSPAVTAPPMYFTTVTTPTFGCPCSIWTPAQRPVQTSAADDRAVEVGVKFRPLADGYVTAVRFYKGALNTGTHVGNLWTSSGTLLGSVTFGSESPTGWQQATLPQPVAVTANTTYVVSYHTNTGGYSADLNYFSQVGVTSGPLQALAEGVSGSNGVFRYGSSAFPTQSFNSANYWVDLVFVSSLPPAPPAPQTVTDTTLAEFNGGTQDAGTALSNIENGEVVLAPQAFSGSSLPAGWSSTPWVTGGSSLVAGGQATVDGALLTSDALLSPNQHLEFMATFNNTASQHAGFGLTLSDGLWAIFSTGAGGELLARTRNGSNPIDTVLPGNWLGSPHRYRIDWNSATVLFFIDGTLVASHTTTFSAQMRPVFSDLTVGDGGLSVGPVFAAPYATNGTFTSRVLDAGSLTSWASALSTVDVPSGTNLTLSARFGNTAAPDASWSPFAGFAIGNSPLSGTSRYVQYQATLLGPGSATPALKDITFTGAKVLPLPTISIGNASVVEGSTGGSYAAFRLSLSAAVTNQVSVSYTTNNATATAGSDFVATSGTAIFPPGSTTLQVFVPIVTDTIGEQTETFLLDLSAPVNATLGTAEGVGTILDDDTPTLSINDASVLEGDAGTTNLVFTASLSTASDHVISASFTTSDGTAVSPQDYAPLSGTVTFPIGITTKQIVVSITSDLIDEPNETFNIAISAPVNALLGDGSGIGTIVDNDPTPSVSINDVTVTETDTGTVAATFTATLSAASGQTVTVSYSTANGSAAAPGDYAPVVSTPLTFAPGQTSRQVTVAVAGDLVDEPTETFQVNLASPVNATIADSQGIGTILDNDPPAIAIADLVVTEGNSGTSNAVFTVSLTSTSTLPVSMNYTTVDGTAQAPADYTLRSGVLTIAAGLTTGQITVPIVGDTRDEPDKTFSVSLSAPVNATIADGTATGTIADNDATPSLVINNVSVNEGDTGTINATFTVTLSAASGQTVTANFATANVTAISPADYTAVTGTLTFAPGTTTQTIIVPVVGDTIEEANETFQVNLTVPVNATLADALGVGTIVDDDPPSISIGNRTLTEGDTGTLNAAFTVTLSFAHSLPVSVNYATVDGTATAPADYTPTSGTLTIAAGATSGVINVPVVGDLLDEANETFSVVLSSPVNGAIAVGTGLGTITDNDPTPTLVVNDVTVTEPDAGGTATATFTVALSAISGRTVTVNYVTANTTATAPADYTALTTATLTFAPGTTTQQVNVVVNGDVLDELDETFQLRLSGAVNATIADATGVGTIADNDAPPTATINDVTITEANSGTRAVGFTVTLSAPSSQTITIAWATANNTAIAPGDYTAASGTITFTAGVLTRPISINSIGDTAVEPNEAFLVNLSNGVNVTILDAQGVGTILNND